MLLYLRLFFNLRDLVFNIVLFVSYIYFSNNIAYHHFYFVKQMIVAITAIVALPINIVERVNMILLSYFIALIILKMDLIHKLY